MGASKRSGELAEGISGDPAGGGRAALLDLLSGEDGSLAQGGAALADLAQSPVDRLFDKIAAVDRMAGNDRQNWRKV